MQHFCIGKKTRRTTKSTQHSEILRYTTATAAEAEAKAATVRRNEMKKMTKLEATFAR